MTNKLVVVINRLKYQKWRKFYHMKRNFLYQITAASRIPDWGGFRPQISLCPQVNLLNPPPEQNSWVRHWPIPDGYDKAHRKSLHRKKFIATWLNTDHIHSYDRRRLDNGSIKRCGVVVYYTLVNLQLFSYWNVTYFMLRSKEQAQCNVAKLLNLTKYNLR